MDFFVKSFNFYAPRICLQQETVIQSTRLPWHYRNFLFWLYEPCLKGSWVTLTLEAIPAYTGLPGTSFLLFWGAFYSHVTSYVGFRFTSFFKKTWQYSKLLWDFNDTFLKLKRAFYMRWASLVSGARLLRHMLYEPYVRKQAGPLAEMSALAAGFLASRASPLSHIDIGNVKRKIRHEPSQAVKGRVRLTGVAPFI